LIEPLGIGLIDPYTGLLEIRDQELGKLFVLFRPEVSNCSATPISYDCKRVHFLKCPELKIPLPFFLMKGFLGQREMTSPGERGNSGGPLAKSLLPEIGKQL
jgi:hypothetical protein